MSSGTVGGWRSTWLGLAMLQLEYFVANLVREFEWREAKGDEVGLSVKPEFGDEVTSPC
ncbi:cytochrome P450 89A2-like isoform X1 [Iris pallida]|uniref:Cytochrome P450 89A2-like isoform X1 n=1 Tax=Iris pallida TaxID=29817 RepID=A0AAX6DLN9_IRIPA|nr:cytochrome P450 89A2-like isoform X1 [Iris pallida]